MKEVKKEIENAGPAEAMEEPAKEEPVLLDIRKSKELNEQRTSTTVHAQGGLQ